MKVVFGVLMAGLMLMSVGAVQAQQEVSIDVALDGYSGYIWRGGILGADDKAVLQPSLTLGIGETGLSFNVWGSAFVQDRTPLDQVDELDLTVDLSRSLGEDSPVSFSVGYIQYTFPSLNTGTKHSEEVYGGLSLDHILAPSVTFYYDFGLIDGWYLTAGVGPEFPLGEEEGGPTFSLGASVGISDSAYGTNGSTGFNDVTVTGSVNFSSGQFSISPTVGFSYADDSINADNSSFWGGISIGFTPSTE